MKRYSKAIGAGLGTGIGAAIATLVIYLMRQFGVEVPGDVEAAIAVLCTSIVTILGVYFSPANDPLPMKNTSRKKHWGGAWLAPLAFLVPFGDASTASAQCPGGICPLPPVVRTVNRTVTRPAINRSTTRTVVRSFGSSGSVYGYGSTGSTYRQNVSNFGSYSYSYGSNGSSYSVFSNRRWTPLRNLFSRVSGRIQARRAARQARRAVYSVPTVTVYQPAPILYQSCPITVSEPTPVKEFECIQPSKREVAKKDFACIRPGTAVSQYDWREPRGTYVPRWIIRDGKTITQHLIDGFPGEHEPLPAAYVYGLSIDERWMLHDSLHDAG